ncbi:MAG: hypothetical protein NZ772_03465 [Cyanobacteria bacterium]|nr:hypothetical protein [Cyanobacteriota bacterium]MDW8200516.1 hypothetical protein [Cyanobacteriota bacterium SKYGB_h_bin112]
MKFQPLDKIAIPFMLALCLLIGVLAWTGEHAAARVRDFSWQDKDIGALDRAFILSFTRPMDHASVEANLQIAPPLPGKISWAGRRMAYTLLAPPPYGEKFQLTLQDAYERSVTTGTRRNVMQPFLATFESRDRAFAYIGVEGEEAGRLVLSNLTKRMKVVLTPKNLLVTDFDIFPDAQRILFAAIDRTAKSPSVLDQKLYTVTTGLIVQAPPEPGERQQPSWWVRPTPPQPVAAKVITPVLENTEYRHYQVQRFKLSADGKTLVMQRVARKNPGAQFGLWAVALTEDGTISSAPVELRSKGGGDFSITPDGSFIAVSEGQGLAIIPIKPDAKPLEFLPKFGQLLAFAQDGTKALTVKFNSDYTRSLFLVTNQGEEKELLKITGSILSAEFDPIGQFAYCILSKAISTPVPAKGAAPQKPPNTSSKNNLTYQEQPFLAMVNLKTEETIPLLALPQQLDVTMSLAPDGLGLLLDQIIVGNSNLSPALRTRSGQAIASSQLWLVPIVPGDPAAQKNTPPTKLPLLGIRPKWLP